MDKQAIKAFINWLEKATERELAQRREEILAAMKLVSSPEARSDVRLALRLLDEEILARLELAQADRKSKQA